MRYSWEDFNGSDEPCGCREADCPHEPLFGREYDPEADKQALCALVDEFSAEMKRKLIEKVDRDGYAGWDSEEWSVDEIERCLLEHVDKGDPVDVANFAAFMWNHDDEI